MRKFSGPIGSVSRVTIESQAVKSNMLGDPSVRLVDVYVPAGHDGQGLPLLVNLVGFTSSGLSQTNWAGVHENLPERLDRLIGEQRMPPVVVAYPDCFTRLGGNQYINSASMGAWEDFLLQEMLRAIEQRFRCGGTGRRPRSRVMDNPFSQPPPNSASAIRGTEFGRRALCPARRKAVVPKREHPRAALRSLPGRPQTISARTTVRQPAIRS